MNLQDKEIAIHGFSWVIFANLLVVMLKLITIPVMARLLEPEDFGLVAVCMGIIMFVSMVGGKGGGSSALIAFKDDAASSWNTVFVFSLFLGVTFTLLLTASADVFFNNFNITDIPVFYVLITIIPLQFISDVLNNRLLIERKFRHESMVSIASESVAGIIALLLAFLGFGIWSLVAQYFISIVLRIGLILSFFYRPNFEFKWLVVKKIYRFSLLSIIVEIFNFIFFYMPVIFSAKFIGPHASGVISVQSRVSALPGDIILQGVSKVIYPLLSSNKLNEHDANRGVIWSSSVNTLFVTPILFGISALAEPIVSIVLGDKYIEYYYVLFSLALMRGIMIPFSSINPYLKATGNIKILCIMFGLRAMFLFAFLFNYSGDVSINHICDSVLISTLAIVPVYICILNWFSELDVNEFAKSVSLYMLSSIIMFVVVVLLYAYFNATSLVGLLLIIFSGGALYCILIVTFDKRFRKISSFSKFKNLIIEIY